MFKRFAKVAHSRTVQSFGDYGHIVFFGQVFVDHGFTSLYGISAGVLALVFAFVAYYHEMGA